MQPIRTTSGAVDTSVALPVRTPPTPWPATQNTSDSAIPSARNDRSAVRVRTATAIAEVSYNAAQARRPARSPSVWRGHTITPTTMYSNAAPGAPVNGLAVPMRSPLNPSPANQIATALAKDTASAGLTLHRELAVVCVCWRQIEVM